MGETASWTLCKTRDAEDCRRYRNSNKMVDRRVFSSRPLNEAWDHWIWVRGRPSNRCSSSRRGYLFLDWSLHLWHSGRSITCYQSQGSCVAHLRGQWSTLSSECHEGFGERDGRRLQISDIWGKRPWLCSQSWISRRRWWCWKGFSNA